MKIICKYTVVFLVLIGLLAVPDQALCKKYKRYLGTFGIVSGPGVRIPGITTATVVQVSGDLGNYHIYWKRGGSDEIIGGGNTLSITESGDYFAYQNISTNPDHPFTRNLGSISIPGLQHWIQRNGPNPLDPSGDTELCLVSNGTAYITSKRWYKNTIEETNNLNRTCRWVYGRPGTYLVSVTYQFGNQNVTINTNTATMLRAAQAPQINVSRTSLDPVSPAPVLTVTNMSNFTQIWIYRDNGLESAQNTPAYTVTRPGRYIIGGLMPGPSTAFTNETLITKGSIPAPVVTSNEGFELTYNNTDLRLYAPSNYNGGYTWYYNNQVISGATSYWVDINRPGTYSVRGCATHFDGMSECKTSVPINVTRQSLPVPIIIADAAQLSYNDPNIRLSIGNYGNNASYTWYFNGTAITSPLNIACDITRPGAYTARVCVSYPDGATDCVLSQPKQITGEVLAINYVRKKTSLKDSIFTRQQLDALPVANVSTTTAYFDGFIRPLQEVKKGFSPQGFDMVTYLTYDQYGREGKKYLPFARQTQAGQYKHLQENRLDPLYNFYSQDNDQIANTAFPYARTIFEASPLNTIIEQGAPGEAWQPGTHANKFGYTTNIGSNDVHHLAFINGPVSGIFSMGRYALGLLNVKVAYNENNIRNRIFIDKAGKTIMSEETGENGENLRTYFVYDGFARLVCIIPPKASKDFRSSTAYPVLQINITDIPTLCFSYSYDGRGRVIKKQVPGGATTYSIYDQWDRPVLTQTSNQLLENKWSFIKYDRFDRPVMSGEITLSGNYETVSQSVVNFYSGVANNLTLRYEEAGNSIHGYTNRSFPILSSLYQAYSVSYYDNYSFVSAFGGNDYQFVPETSINVTEYSQRVSGLVTGLKVMVLGTQDYLKTVNYYDKDYRLIQSRSDNYVGGKDFATIKYDFTGKVTKELEKHQGPETVVVLKEYSYDHSGRLLKTYHKLNNGEKILLADNHYNELGELIEKNLHQDNDGNFLQSLDYTYNIRGWLSGVNVPSSDPNASLSDMYAFELKYNESLNNAAIEHVPTYNGNISAFTETRPYNTEASGTAFKSTYSYKYDPRNQLKQAKYYQISNPVKNGLFDVTGINYDPNGNILQLKRKGLINGVPGLIDDLTYTYDGNQLMEVNDAGNANKGFIKR